MEFEWHECKAFINWVKHGVRFEEAQDVFDDPYRRLLSDPLHSTADERRDKMVGLSRTGLLLVVFTDRRGRIRIISARKAHRKERRIYHEE